MGVAHRVVVVPLLAGAVMRERERARERERVRERESERERERESGLREATPD